MTIFLMKQDFEKPQKSISMHFKQPPGGWLQIRERQSKISGTLQWSQWKSSFALSTASRRGITPPHLR